LVLSSENRRQLWIPPGFAHGFVVLSPSAELLYKTTDYWAPEYERTIAWNDPSIGIEWPIDRAPVLSAKDELGRTLRESEVFA
jgi:dTDP-4-dehydrorhamnose 3,5-epimerase